MSMRGLVSIQAGYQIDPSSGLLIIGGSTLPKASSTKGGKNDSNCIKPATKAMVFLVSGASTCWKMTVGYALTGGSVCAKTIANMIIEIIKRCQIIGIDITDTVMDMGPVNQGVQRQLGISLSRGREFSNSFVVNNQIVRVLADSPHLLRNIRNMMFKWSFFLSEETVRQNNLPTNKVSIGAIKALVDFQDGKTFKLAPHLNTDYLDGSSNFKKMKVKPAKAIQSRLRIAFKQLLPFALWSMSTDMTI